MKRILIACGMLEDEIDQVSRELDCKIPVIWVERGFHNSPGKLKEKLQDLIDQNQDCDEILLSFGLCGNGTEGLISQKTRLVLPKFDDCINMLLCGEKRVCRGLTEPGSLYLTRGWTLDSEAILTQYEQYVTEYGEESAEAILEMMYEHYETISVIDTGYGQLSQVLDYAGQAAQLLGLSTRTVKGSVRILRQLLSGCHGEDLIVKEPGDPVKQSDFDISN